jgi:WhiB family redox-sensing transcriptional regulator
MFGVEPRLTYRTAMGWADSAACRESDPELFFPLSTAGPSVYQTEQARAVCDRCAVRSECLSWALSRGIAHGVWGGLTEHERREASPSAVHCNGAVRPAHS